MKISIPIFPDFLALTGVVFITFLPITGHLLTQKFNLSLSENRVLASVPENVNSITELSKQTEAYINDNFGWRFQAIKLEKQIRNLWGDGDRTIYHGIENWLFWSEALIWDSYLGRSGFSEDHLAGWSDLINEMKNDADHYKADFVATIVPNKVSIYPEFAPDRFGNKSPLNFYDYLFKTQEYSEINFINLKSPLIDAKQLGPLYYKTDTHWNNRGAFIAYQTLLRDLPYKILEQKTLGQEEQKFSGDLARFTNTKTYETISDITIPKVDGFSQRRLNNPAILDEWQTKIYERNGSDGPVVVVIGDSFSVRYVELLKHSFNSVILVHHKLGAFKTDEIYIHNPDVVILSPVERYSELIIKNRQNVQ